MVKNQTQRLLRYLTRDLSARLQLIIAKEGCIFMGEVILSSTNPQTGTRGRIVTSFVDVLGEHRFYSVPINEESPEKLYEAYRRLMVEGSFNQMTIFFQVHKFARVKGTSILINLALEHIVGIPFPKAAVDIDLLNRYVV
jgi:hypothetical protein